MGETVREHAEIQGLLLRTLAFQYLICDTEHGGAPGQPTVHYGHAGRHFLTHSRNYQKPSQVWYDLLARVGYSLAQVLFAHVNRGL